MVYFNSQWGIFRLNHGGHVLFIVEILSTSLCPSKTLPFLEHRDKVLGFGEIPLDCKIKPVNPKRNQPWIFIRRTHAEAEAPVLWPPDAKSRLIRKDPDAGKDWRQEEKGMTEHDLVGWHHWLNGHEFEQAPWDGKGQGSRVCCSPWGGKELDMTERLNNNISMRRNQAKSPLHYHILINQIVSDSRINFINLAEFFSNIYVFPCILALFCIERDQKCPPAEFGSLGNLFWVPPFSTGSGGWSLR